jgi:hypothetical protein
VRGENGQQRSGRVTLGPDRAVQRQPVDEGVQPIGLELGVAVRRELSGLLEQSDGVPYTQPSGVLRRVTHRTESRLDLRTYHEGLPDLELLPPFGVQGEQLGEHRQRTAASCRLGDEGAYPQRCPLDHKLQRETEQIVLAGEVVPQGTRRPAGFRGHAANRYGVQAVAAQHAPQRVSERAIVACEIGFWVLLGLGLIVRYALRWPRTSVVLLASVPDRRGGECR